MTRIASQRFLENLFLYLSFAVLYSVALGSLPPRLELFEEWVNFYLPLLDKPLSIQLKEYISIRPNDSNQSVNAPIWLGLVYMFRAITGDVLVGTRLPSILLSALSPVLLAEFVRRFYRKDLALLAGLALGSQQLFMTFARTGGYIAPTVSLLLGILLVSGMIAFENNRKAWIALVVMLAIAPFFYSTIRYYELLGLALIAYRFLGSAEFRKKHLAPLLVSVVVLSGVAFALTEGGKRYVAMMYISARGEQFLLPDKVMLRKEGIDSQELTGQIEKVLTTRVPEQLSQLVPFYQNGKRFVNYRLWQRHDGLWNSLRPWFLWLLVLGAVRCLFLSVKQHRYLLPLVWSVWAWLPLLVTTGITPNRMLLGLPADLFMMLLALVLPMDLARRYIRQELVTKALYLGALGCVVWGGYVTTTIYFQDYISYPGL